LKTSSDSADSKASFEVCHSNVQYDVTVASFQLKIRFGLHPITGVIFFKRLCSENRARWKIVSSQKMSVMTRTLQKKTKRCISFLRGTWSANVSKIRVVLSLFVFEGPLLPIHKKRRSENYREGSHTGLTTSCQLSRKNIKTKKSYEFFQM